MLQSLAHQGQHMMIIQGVEGFLAFFAELPDISGLLQMPQNIVDLILERMKKQKEMKAMN